VRQFYDLKRSMNALRYKVVPTITEGCRPSITSSVFGQSKYKIINIINLTTMEGPVIHKSNFISRIISLVQPSKSTLVEIIGFLFIILFLYTGISKLMEYSVFKEQIAESPILEPVAPFIAWTLPLTEFFVSLLLIIPRWRLKGLYASLFLMIAFTIYIGTIMTFNEKLPCSCGGIISLLSWRDHLIFNSLFIILGYMGVRMQRQIRRSLKQELNINHP
jgi:uncharacterized membrane protein YphA (DoxX/SURF4 family)